MLYLGWAPRDVVGARFQSRGSRKGRRRSNLLWSRRRRTSYTLTSFHPSLPIITFTAH